MTVITVCREIDFVIKDDPPSVWLNRPNLLCVPGVSNAVRTVTTSQSPQVTQNGLKFGLNFMNVYDI